MRKRWFLVGMIFLLVPWLLVGCGVAQEQYDAVMADLGKAQQELQSVKDELQTTQAKVSELTSSLEKAETKLETTQTELDTTKAKNSEMTSNLEKTQTELDATQAELLSAKSHLSAAQSTIETQEQTMTKAQTFAEVLSIIFVPAMTGEPVNEFELLIRWIGKIKATEDAEFQRLFDAVIDSEGGESELIDFLVYVFETLPKLLAVSGESTSKREAVAAETELGNIQTAVIALMIDNGLSTLPNPVTVATNDMSAFPDATSVAGSADKQTDSNGNSYTASDKNGYILYQHDITTDNAQTGLVNYITVRYTKGTYTVDAYGTVTQVTTGYE